MNNKQTGWARKDAIGLIEEKNCVEEETISVEEVLLRCVTVMKVEFRVITQKCVGETMQCVHPCFKDLPTDVEDHP